MIRTVKCYSYYLEKVSCYNHEITVKISTHSFWIWPPPNRWASGA